MARRSGNNKNNSTARIGFEAKLWLAADKLRSNMDAAEYKHTTLALRPNSIGCSTRRISLSPSR